jgi:hypothetical protein
MGHRDDDDVLARNSINDLKRKAAHQEIAVPVITPRKSLWTRGDFSECSVKRRVKVIGRLNAAFGIPP